MQSNYSNWIISINRSGSVSGIKLWSGKNGRVFHIQLKKNDGNNNYYKNIKCSKFSNKLPKGFDIINSYI